MFPEGTPGLFWPASRPLAGRQTRRAVGAQGTSAASDAGMPKGESGMEDGIEQKINNKKPPQMSVGA